jgi:hypothetical protein
VLALQISQLCAAAGLATLRLLAGIRRFSCSLRLSADGSLEGKYGGQSGYVKDLSYLALRGAQDDRAGFGKISASPDERVQSGGIHESDSGQVDHQPLRVPAGYVAQVRGKGADGAEIDLSADFNRHHAVVPLVAHG